MPLAKLVPTAAAPLVLASACGGADGLVAEEQVVAQGKVINLSPDQKRVTAEKDSTIAALVPEAVRRTGRITIGGSAGTAPPLRFYATDDKTPIGVETDIAVLIAQVLVLEPQLEVSSWENLFVGPNPTAAHHVATSGKTEIIGSFSGGGEIQGKIAATTKKDSGLVKPVAEALNLLIRNGEYAEVLDRWGLTSEAVPTSVINPPGLPRS